MPNSLTLLGCGRMGTAMLKGWLSSDLDLDIAVVEPKPHAAITSLGVSIVDDAKHLNGEADILICALKPQVLGDVLPTAKDALAKDGMLISIAAGTTLESLERHVGEGVGCVRAMPNLPATVGEGITGCIANEHVSTGQKEMADSLLAAVGDVVWLEDEALMDAITGVSGSGPAYVFYFMECMMKAAKQQGFSEEQALKLVRQTIKGSIALQEKTAQAPAELREQVTSPGGTTEAALKRLQQGQEFSVTIKQAVDAAIARSKELSG